MKRIYLLLAIAGAIVPYIFFGRFIMLNGLDVVALFRLPFANLPAAGFTADLFISSFIFWLMMFADRKEGRGPNPLIFIALNLLIGLSCALPAYLYARTPDGK